MKFPGARKRKHYFPVGDPGRLSFDYDFLQRGHSYVVGIDQLLVDIEIDVEDEVLAHWGLKKGESSILADDLVEEIYQKYKKENKIIGEFPGGSIGNTLHNYSLLSDDRSLALGTICKNITVGDYAFKYICSTSSKVDFSYLRPVDGPMGRALCFITPDGERTFGIGKGAMNELGPEHVPEHVVANACVLLISSFLLRDESSPMFKATFRAAEIAKENGVPVVFSLGVASLIHERREFFTHFIGQFVNILAMNQDEAQALTGETDPLLAGKKSLEMVDMALLTVGDKGLYLCAHVDEELARETNYPLVTKSVTDYNRWEFSRAMKKMDCKKPMAIYTHINPYLGGPKIISNTNGAGDAALAALLHDIAANTYHREIVPNSPKHLNVYLTYSSLSQVGQYASRVSYEVLMENSPRLYRGLPVTADCLEQYFWEK